jgi:uncharacterized membrane protein YhfC
MTITAAPSAGWWIVSIGAVLAYMLIPIGLILIARARLKVGWKYALFGALIFFIFQIITRVPAIYVVQLLLAPTLKQSQVALYGFIFVAALTAGIFEEVGRYLGYRWFMGREEKTRAKAILYGLGHGGLESMVLIGGVAALTLLNVWLIVSTQGGIVPAAQRPAAADEIAAIVAEPLWLPLLGVWERLCAMTIHVALSIVVLQVFRRGSIKWLWLAIALHTLVDFVSLLLVQALPLSTIPKDLIVEGVIGLFALGAVWLIFHLRDRPEDAARAGAVMAAPNAVPLAANPLSDN